jgi:hypothetical protein
MPKNRAKLVDLLGDHDADLERGEPRHFRFTLGRHALISAPVSRRSVTDRRETIFGFPGVNDQEQVQ